MHGLAKFGWALGMWAALPLWATETPCPQKVLGALNTAHLTLHHTKEMQYWAMQMGLTSAAEGAADVSETALRQWASDPANRLTAQRALVLAPPGPVRDGLQQWIRFFDVNQRPDLPAPLRWTARLLGRVPTEKMFADLLAAEAALQADKKAHPLVFAEVGQAPVPTTQQKLMLVAANDPDVKQREAAFDQIRQLERRVAQHLPEIIRRRNAVARRLGFSDYYAWKVGTNEGITKEALFKILDELEKRTRPAAYHAIVTLIERHGTSVRKPWNFPFFTRGDITKDLDPYFPFEDVLRRTGQTFAGLGVDFQGAVLTMDLVNRLNKYQNGFIRAPIPSHMDYSGDEPRFVSAVTHFSSNAIPGQVGSGYDATRTVLHEMGHHAGFSNIRTASVAGSQEESPTSIATSELQSMFFDSLQNDPAWLALYARDRAGRAVPWELVEKNLRSRHLLRAHGLRAMLAVSYFEKALYEMDEARLSPAHLLTVAHRIEEEMLLTEGSSRPLLTVSHIQSAESSAYYHGYTLASVGVDITRNFFLERDGYLVNNRRIGPAMAKAYWHGGNTVSFVQMIENLTGRPFSLDSVIRAIDMDEDQYVRRQLEAFEAAFLLPQVKGPVKLNGHFIMAHGDQQITSTVGGKTYEQICDEYADWIRLQEAARP